MTRMAIIGLCATTLGLAACGPRSYGPGDIDDGTPSGTVDGASWTMVEASVSIDGTDLDIDLYAEDVDECAFASTDLPQIMFSVPNEVGDYELYLQGLFDGRTATFFVPPSNNIIATNGLIQVRAVSATEVTIGLVIDGGDGNFLSGTFTTPICD